MPFMKGIAPIRRTAKYLNAGGLVFKERVKIVTVNFNDLADSQSHKGAQAGTESVMDQSCNEDSSKIWRSALGVY